ncbi:MAG: hypothetical protein WCS31_09080 [Verrucomicrobiae bacterium]
MDLKDFGFPLLGKLAAKKSTDIPSSRLGVGFETLDRDMWDVSQAWPVLDALGVKCARVQTGWAKSENERGVYRFEWLDEIVDKLIERGVAPWFSVSYGNQLYTPEATADGTGFPPIYTESERAGWTAYVQALARHYKGRVNHFEIWNEPDAGFFKPKPDPALYAALVKLTATAIKSVSPGAFIIGGAFGTAMHPGGLEFSSKCLEAGMAEHIDAISYHGYKYMPEQYAEQEYPAYLRLIQSYKPTLQYWQGETGCPSKVPPGNKQALAEMDATEEIQARWLTRRVLLELGMDASLVSYFNMGDFTKYTFAGDLGYTSHYGVLRMEDGSRKPSYYALQSLATLLHDPLEVAAGRTSFRMQTGDDDNPVTRSQAASAWQVNLVRGGVPVHAWWLREEVGGDPDWKSITMYYWLDKSLRLSDPVLIDPISQDVYQLELKRNYNMNEFANLPISNTPLLVTDRSVVPIRA